MNRDEGTREGRRDHISRLSAAVLRISASLDVNTILREIVEGARALTGADSGTVATVDDSGQLEDIVSSGYTPEELRQLAAWSDCRQVFEHLSNIPGALRLRDAPGYIRSLGYSSPLTRPKTFLGTTMRYQDVHVGTVFLNGKEGEPEFTSEDEEILVLFASQAAVAIANARTYQAERRPLADLETLVDTLPVGVVVLEARTVKPISFNREAMRIVEGLRTPGQPPEQLLEVVTCRFGDGREFSAREFPLVQELSNATGVRAEEIVLKVPDGRSVTTLFNATPVRSEDGTVESVIITLQDLAPLKELERLRAEFLGMVSHELRVPLTSIKGSAATALRASPTADSPVVQQLLRIIDEQADHTHSLIDDLLDAGRIEAGTLAVDPEPTEVASLVEQARKMFLSGEGRHPVQIDLPPDLPRVMADRVRIVQVLTNLLSNAARHSALSSPIRVSAMREGVHVAIAVSDQGQGVPPDLLPHLFRKYSRSGGDRGIRGSGLGLAICKGLVEAHGGRIRAESGGTVLGTRFTFTIPVAEDAATSFARSSSRPPWGGEGRTRILVVDDDPQTLRLLRAVLEPAGYSPLMTGNPAKVSRLIQTKKPRLVLLDLVLPGTDGIELMERLPELADLPVIFISGYGQDETIVRALEAGAADYIVKPFSPTELVARVQAALRRRDQPPEPFRLGDLAIHYEAHQVTFAGHPVRLTAIEYELLRVLSVNAGRVMTYASLLRQVWGLEDHSDYRPVRTLVKTLRRKLGDKARRPNYIFTVRQVGYRMPQPSDR